MKETMSERLSGYWSFALAASAAPLSYLVAAPCGIVCGSCPLGGACFVASPLMFGTVIVIKFGHSVKWRIRSVWARLTGATPPARPVQPHLQIIDIEDPEDERVMPIDGE